LGFRLWRDIEKEERQWLGQASGERCQAVKKGRQLEVKEGEARLMFVM
jgi:hypothetical protein